jgi:hypothetical protein
MATLERSPSVTVRRVSSAFGDGHWAAEDLVAEVAARDHDVRPFEPRTLDLCAAVSKRLLDQRDHPEVVSLGYWMRPAAIDAMRRSFEASVPNDQLAVPRGLAFHVTPANVDTLFVYSWVLSLLVGNANIVRLSSRDTEVRARILGAIGAALDDPALREHAMRHRFVLTDHDEETLRMLSAAADLRIVWGGDATVERYRSLPTPPHARDVVFPDRHSLAILDATVVSTLDAKALASVADRFFNDAFWFDQGACSSPRLLLWRAGATSEATETAIRRFRDAVLEATRRRHYVAETGMALNKMAFATDVAGRLEAVHIESTSNEAHWVRLPAISDYDRENCGGGLFFEVVSQDLASDLLRLIRPRDQTVTTFGLDQATLEDLARRLNGRGVDRFVPLGQALTFSSTWDGSDLLREFSKRVVVDAGRAS